MTSDIQSTNKVKDMPNQMLPMMLVLASIVGTMIMGMNFSVSTNILGASVTKMGKMAARIIVTVDCCGGRWTHQCNDGCCIGRACGERISIPLGFRILILINLCFGCSNVFDIVWERRYAI